MRKLLVVGALLLMLASTGCSMSIDVVTSILSPDEIEQQFAMTLEGMEGMDDAEFEQPDMQDEMDGWETEITRGEDSVTVTYRKQIAKGDALFPPSQSDDMGTQPEFMVEVEENPEAGWREYRVSIAVPPSENSPTASSPDEQLDPEAAKMAEEMAKMMAAMFKFSWSINVPGEVVDTNADILTDGGGTWVFDLMDKSQEPRQLKIVSRESMN